MSWFEKLYETYQRCAAVGAVGSDLWPVSHVVKRAHVEVVLDESGNFRRARLLDRTESATLIPATELSAGRTSGVEPHPLCEELGYCAADLPGVNKAKHTRYLDLLCAWSNSQHGDRKVRAICAYIAKRCLWADLSREVKFPIKVEIAQKKWTALENAKVFVRWGVEEIGVPASGTWEDAGLISSWISFDASQHNKTGVCIVTGNRERLAQSHPRFLRHAGDGAKLISANDYDGFTFRGRFTDTKKLYEKQTCSVSYTVTQKAHAALRWLIRRQGLQIDEQVVVAWASSGVSVPEPWEGSDRLLGMQTTDTGTSPNSVDDAGQTFGLQLRSAILGYAAELKPTDDVAVMSLGSATKGRASITYYREMRGSEFLERILTWHERLAWHQTLPPATRSDKVRRFVGSASLPAMARASMGPSPKGKRVATLIRAGVERLLPCVIEGRQIPMDVCETTYRAAVNRLGFNRNIQGGDEWEWEQAMGIACSLFKGHHAHKDYQMALELDRNSSDYLFGRLLAVAERIEGMALHVAHERRDTNAARLMQRFADRPSSTWRTLELSLVPYKTRLLSKRPAFLNEMQIFLDSIFKMFSRDDFVSDNALTAEFLLGYHCQRGELWQRKAEHTSDDASVAKTPNEVGA